MEYTKENIINEYKKLRDFLGQSPSRDVFIKETSISEYILTKIFWSKPYWKLASECGDTPREFWQEKSNLQEILIQWGKLVTAIGKMPTIADWQFYKIKPNSWVIFKTHKIKWAELPYKFMEFYSNNPEWSDVIALIPERSWVSKSENGQSYAILKIPGMNFENLKFIPPVIQDLVELSVDEEKAREFEKDVNLVFQMLGFDVTDYGQGTGRNPDWLAKENQHRYAILIDAKARKDGYKLGTEDRKFIEYIKTFSEPLRKSGFTNIYFLIVSSNFDSISQVWIKNIKVETQVTATFITSRNLLKLLSKKIQFPRLFDLKKFQELLIVDGEISETIVDKFLSSLK